MLIDTGSACEVCWSRTATLL